MGGLIIGGTTGEGHLMSWDEHIMLIAHTVNRFGRQVSCCLAPPVADQGGPSRVSPAGRERVR